VKRKTASTSSPEVLEEAQMLAAAWHPPFERVGAHIEAGTGREPRALLRGAEEAEAEGAVEEGSGWGEPRPGSTDGVRMPLGGGGRCSERAVAS